MRNCETVFGELWFQRHQAVLLRLCNSKLTKLWFRWVLRITASDCDIRQDIACLAPNRFSVLIERAGERVTLRTDFRTCDKYGRRLYFAFRPLWWALHSWDCLVDRKWQEASFGFSSLTAYSESIGTGNPVDGYVARFLLSGNETFSTIRTSAGNANDETQIDNPAWQLTADTTGQNDKYYALYRAIHCFDTSAIGSGSTVSAATFSLYGNLSSYPKSDTFSLSSGNGTTWPVTSTPASTSALADADYGQLGSTKQSDSGIVYSSWENSNYNNFTLNATGYGNVSKTGISKYGTRGGFDIDNSAPTWVADGNALVGFTGASFTGTTRDPKLVVTYSGTTPASGNFFFLI